MSETVEAVAVDAAEIVQVVKNNPVVVAAALVGGLVVGAFVGWKWKLHKLRLQVEQEVEKEAEAIRDFYSLASKKDYPTPADAAKDLIPNKLQDDAAEALKTYRDGVPHVAYHKVTVDRESLAPAVTNGHILAEQQVEIARNVFEDPFDYSAEVAMRTPDEPYIITKDEFLENEHNHSQESLTFYEGDDALSDSKDQVLVNPKNLVGADTLDRFGYGSEDENIVYVRNEKLELDFEIARSPGSFGEEVLGFKHSDTSSRRFRLNSGD